MPKPTDEAEAERVARLWASVRRLRDAKAELEEARREMHELLDEMTDGSG